MNTPATAGGEACLHCGLPVAGGQGAPATIRRRAGGAPGPFCCSGCALAHALGRDLDSQAPDRLLARIVLSAFLAMGVMVFSLALYGGEHPAADPDELSGDAARALEGLLRLGAMGLASIVVYLIGLPLVSSVRHAGRYLSADGLILTGVGAAYLLSVWGTLSESGEVYFETVTMVLVLVGLGRWLDARAKERARGALADLAEETVAPAARVGPAGEESVPPEELRVGDRVRVRPGETIPVDGVVESGAAFLDTSALTGESEPRSVRAGERVLAGAVALDGSLLVRASAVGDGRIRAEVERLLRRALDRSSDAVRLADRVAAVLLPAVVALAAGAFAWHARAEGFERGLFVALSVLLISCPCALGIATPLAFWTSLGEAWRRGLLIKGGDVLERLARARWVLLDKTGTLTEPGLDLEQVRPCADVSAQQALRTAAALEIASEHPIGRALRKASAALETELPAVEGFQVLPGRGVEGRIDAVLHRLVRDSARTAREGEGSAERTSVVLERDGKPIARFELGARPRPEARRVVAELRRLGLEVRVLTGDAPGPARRIERVLGVPVEAELLPGDKVRRIEQAGPAGVVFVGDGLNDAAALAAADVGVALECGSPRSLEVADVALLRPGIAGLPDLFVLARRAVRLARGNLAWAFAYNGVGLLLAATGRLQPIVAAALMVASSIAVGVHSSRGAAGSRAIGSRPAVGCAEEEA